MKKRVLALLIATVMMLSLLAGCGNSKVESYKTMAQGFIDSNDKAAAIKILEQGVSETDNEELKAMLEELSKVDFSSYIGTWAENGLCWDGGGLTLDVTVENDKMILACALTQAAPASRVAEIQKEINLADIVDSSVEIPYDNDSWGNSGKLKITFAENAITCEFSDIVTDDLAQWGFYEAMYSLIKNDNAHELLTYTQEEYDAKYGEPEEPQQPTYDTSKASGILAQLGMTEEAFRASCQLLNNASSDDVRVTQELLDYPSQYIGQHFTFGHYSNEKPSLDYMEVSSKGTSTDGYTTYTYYPGYSFEDYIKIFDMRDDIYAPTISDGDDIYPYMIFIGVQTINGTDYLCFQLISVDKI